MIASAVLTSTGAALGLAFSAPPKGIPILLLWTLFPLWAVVLVCTGLIALLKGRERLDRDAVRWASFTCVVGGACILVGLTIAFILLFPVVAVSDLPSWVAGVLMGSAGAHLFLMGFGCACVQRGREGREEGEETV